MQFFQLLKIFNFENTRVPQIIRIPWVSYSLYIFPAHHCPIFFNSSKFSSIKMYLMFAENKKNTTEDMKLY